MAKINIERKKSVWPWIIALIVILLLAWGAFALMEDRGGLADRPVATTPATTTPTPATDPAATTTGDAVRDTPPPPADDTTPPQQ